MGFDTDNWKSNREQALKDENILKLIQEMKMIQKTINNFFHLSFDRTFLHIRNNGPFNPGNILYASTYTIESIVSCLQNANFSDAYVLLRKYRDDLFFYVYMILVSNDSKEKILSDEPLNKHEKNMLKWLKNELTDLNISEILQYLGKSTILQSTVKKYNLHSSFNDMGVVLNNYVHANGIAYYNQSYSKISAQSKQICIEFIEQMHTITTIFFVLIILVNPFLSMSLDYIDSLEMKETPIPESISWVAPFLVYYFDKNKEFIDKNINKYLKDETGMDF